MEMTELQSCFGEREGSSGALKKKKRQVCKNCVSVKAYKCSVRIRDTFQRQESESGAEQKGRDRVLEGLDGRETKAQVQK